MNTKQVIYMNNQARIAILLPCYNEALTITKVIRDFQTVLPSAEIWVYDNNSGDNSTELAIAAGANIRRVRQQGKGHVVRRMFQEIEADCYVMADSDDTYPADEVGKLIGPILSGDADMVNGDRLSSTYGKENKRPMHNFGNSLVCGLISLLFRQRILDVMTGYRAFSRKFVKNCPVWASGFEVETELTLFALDRRMNILEVPITYRDRPSGSLSKLNTVRDGMRVLKTIFNLFRNYRPMLFFGTIAWVLGLLSTVLFIPIFSEYLRTGLVPRFPTLIGCGVGLICGLLSFVCGLILESTKKYSDQIFEILVSQENERSANHGDSRKTDC
jgi:glycosyltransferase involved in cell wall biosynthesis